LPSPVPCPVCRTLGDSVRVVVDDAGRALYFFCVAHGAFYVGTK
jgi:hypothetical protein